MNTYYVIALGLLLAAPLHCQSHDSLGVDQTNKRPRFHISLNGIYAFLETNIRFESTSGIMGAKISMEDHLGMDKSRLMPMVSARFNVKNRHNIFGLYYGLPRDAYHVTRRELEFNGRIIEEGTEIFSHFNTNIYSLGYMYDAVSNSKSRLGLFVNFYIMTVATGVSSNDEQISENLEVTLPLPNFGAQAYYKLGERVGLFGIFSVFFLSLDDFSGAIHTLGGQVEFYLAPWLDLSLGYYLFDLNIEVDEANFTGIFDYVYQGPFLGLGFRF